MTSPYSASTEPGVLDTAWADDWYQKWISAWNDKKFSPDDLSQILTDDFVLDSPTTRHTGSTCKGVEATSAYIDYVTTAYHDLTWVQTAPTMFDRDAKRAAFTWVGTGHFSGVMHPPGIQGNGNAFEFTGLEVFSFRDGKACQLYAVYDLIGLMKQLGLYSPARLQEAPVA
jgi:hypothetical protein